jgi:thiosulfate/3-mercaptopyruvate sulfurtransferase
MHDPLVSTAWLAAHLDDSDVVVIDASCKIVGVARDGAAAFAAAHIPGARFFDIDAVSMPGSTLPHMLPPAALFAEKVGALGIGNDTHVICTDGFGLMTAARAWWMFVTMGHRRVSVLDGGLPRWQAEGRPVAVGLSAPPAAVTYTATFEPALVRDADAVAAHLADGTAQVLDARAAGRFTGEAVEPWPGRRTGHMPGARNLPFNQLFDPATGLMLAPEALQGQFENAGITADRPVVTSCGSGVTASVLALGLARVGREDWAVYDGSWAEWGLPESGRPVVTGPA